MPHPLQGSRRTHMHPRRPVSPVSCSAVIVTAFATSIATAQTILRVRQGAPAGGNGSSWAAAYDDLQPALAAAPPNSEIWAAAGTYYPINPTSTDRTATLW